MFPDGPKDSLFTKVISYALGRRMSALVRLSVGLSFIDQVEHAPVETAPSFQKGNRILEEQRPDGGT